MPELPEVETTLRGISPWLEGKQIRRVTVYNRALRWPIPDDFEQRLEQCKVRSIQRRAKYLLFETAGGYFMLHLGMSGSLRIASASEALLKHDHIVFELAGKRQLRFNDPRRFGCALWLGAEPFEHELLAKLGFEPLGPAASAEALFELSRKRRVAIKNFIMDNHIMVGVGNIYANESLFLAGIRPTRRAGKVSRREYITLLEKIQQVLRAAISMGGSTLRDFVGGDGKPGYFQQTLNVYDRAGEACPQCDNTIKLQVIGQRASYYCPSCQR